MFDLSQFSLKGKVAVVTGGGRGIGQAIAFGFARSGAKVVITSRKAQDLEATAAEIKAFGGEAFPLPAHLGKMDEIQKMVNTVMDRFGRIDILVNNAGASPAMGSVLESDERLWDTIMNLNLKGVYFVSQAVARIMKKQGGGKIINIASVDGFNPEPVRERLFRLQGRRTDDYEGICQRAGPLEYPGQHHRSGTHQHQDDEFPLGAPRTGRGRKGESGVGKDAAHGPHRPAR